MKKYVSISCLALAATLAFVSCGDDDDDDDKKAAPVEETKDTELETLAARLTAAKSWPLSDSNCSVVAQVNGEDLEHYEKKMIYLKDKELFIKVEKFTDNACTSANLIATRVNETGIVITEAIAKDLNAESKTASKIEKVKYNDDFTLTVTEADGDASGILAALNTEQGDPAAKFCGKAEPWAKDAEHKCTGQAGGTDHEIELMLATADKKSTLTVKVTPEGGTAKEMKFEGAAVEEEEK